MKLKLLISYLVISASTAIFADDIKITPGSTITLTPSSETTVSCAATSSDLDYCRCESDGGQWNLYRYRKIETEVIKDLLVQYVRSETNCNRMMVNGEFAALCNKP